jgi:hypothetical protein
MGQPNDWIAMNRKPLEVLCQQRNRERSVMVIVTISQDLCPTTIPRVILKYKIRWDWSLCGLPNYDTNLTEPHQ